MPKNQKVGSKLLEQKEMERNPEQYALKMQHQIRQRRRILESQVQDEMPQLRFENVPQALPQKRGDGSQPEGQSKNTREFQEDLETITIEEHLPDLMLVKVMREGEGNLPFLLIYLRISLLQSPFSAAFRARRRTSAPLPLIAGPSLSSLTRCSTYFILLFAGFGEIALRSDKHRTATIVCKK